MPREDQAPDLTGTVINPDLGNQYAQSRATTGNVPDDQWIQDLVKQGSGGKSTDAGQSTTKPGATPEAAPPSEPGGGAVQPVPPQGVDAPPAPAPGQQTTQGGILDNLEKGYLWTKQHVEATAADVPKFFDALFPKEDVQNYFPMTRQIIGGAADALNQTMQTIDMGVAAAEKAGLPNVYVQLFDPKGNWDPKVMSVEEMQAARKAGGEVPIFQIPTTASPQGRADALVRGLSNFVTGSVTGGKILKTLGVTGPVVTRILSSAFAGGVTMDPKDTQNLIAMLPDGDLKAAITAPPGQEGEPMARLESAITATGLGEAGILVGRTLLGAVRMIRGAVGGASRVAPEAPPEVPPTETPPPGAPPVPPDLKQVPWEGRPWGAPEDTLEPKPAAAPAEGPVIDFSTTSHEFAIHPDDPAFMRKVLGGSAEPLPATWPRAQQIIDEWGQDTNPHTNGAVIYRNDSGDPIGIITYHMGEDEIANVTGVHLAPTVNPASKPSMVASFKTLIEQEGHDYADNAHILRDAAVGGGETGWRVAPRDAMDPQAMENKLASWGVLDESPGKSAIVDNDGQLKAIITYRGVPEGTPEVQGIYLPPNATASDVNKVVDKLWNEFRGDLHTVDVETGEARLIRDESEFKTLMGQAVKIAGHAPTPEAAVAGATTPEATTRPPSPTDIGPAGGPRFTIDEAAYAKHQATPSGPSDPVVAPNFAKINLEAIENGEDVSKTVTALANELAIRKTPRSLVSALREVVKQLGPKAAEQYQVGLINAASAGDFSSRMLEAAAMTLRSSSEQLVNLAKIATETGSDAAKLQFAKAWAVHRQIQDYIGAVTKGQSRDLSALKESTQDTTRVFEEFKAKFGGEDFDRLTAMVADMDPSAAGEFIRKAPGATTRDHIMYFMYNAFLSNPATVAGNIIGNTASGILQIAERFTAATVVGPGGRIMRAALGKTNPATEEGVSIKEATAYLYGYLSSVKGAFQLAFKGLKSGEGTFGGANTSEGVPQVMMGGKNYRTDAWRNPENVGPENPLQTIGSYFKVFLPLRWQTAGDDLFKWMTYRAELNAQAVRQGLSEGLTGQQLNARVASLVENPSDAMDQAAVFSAKKSTFNQPLGPTMNNLMRFVDSMNIPVPGTAGAQIPIGRMLIPFMRTPANIMGDVYSHTLMSRLFPTGRLAQEFAAGGATRDLAYSRIVTGSMISAAVVDMFANGTIDGGGPSDPTDLAAWKAAGHEPYTIRIGDKRFGYKRISVIGDLIGMTADAAQVMQDYFNNANLEDGDSKKIQNLAESTTLAFANAILNRSQFQNLATVFDAIQTGGDEGAKKLQFFESSFTGTAATRLIERVMDPTLRAHYNLIEAIKAETPGFSKDLPPTVDIWGRDRKAVGGYLPGVDPRYAQIISPIPVRDVGNVEPIDKFLSDNHESIQRMSRTQNFGIGGKASASMKLNPQEYYRLQQLAGNAWKDPQTGLGLMDRLNAIVQGRGPDSDQVQWDNLKTPDAKMLFIKAIITKYREAAKKTLLQENPDLMDRVVGQTQKNYQKLTGEQPPQME